MSRRICALGVAALIIVTGCGSDAPEGAPGRSVAASGVGIVAAGCSLVAHLGSGVVVGTPGQVVTVAHTVRGATDISVIDADGVEHPATVRAFDKDADLAVLAVPGLDAPPLQLAPVTLGAGGALTWGHDEGVEYIAVDVVKRLQITIEDIYVEEIVERSGLEVAAEITVGDSGGPILDQAGDVIGILYANSRDRGGVGFATDSDEVRAVLARVSDTDVDNGRCV